MRKIVLGFLVLAAISCKKSLVTEDVPSSSLENASNVQNATVLHRNTKFGTLINGSFTPDQRASIAASLNANYMRSTICMDQWAGSSGSYDTYVNDGFEVIPNVSTTAQTGKPVPFTKDLTSYRSTFTSIVNKYQPEVIVVENEEINPHYHSGPMTDYINMLKVAISVCHAKGVKVTNGGIYGTPLEVLTYRYLQTKSQKRADSFCNNCMLPFQIKAAQNPNSNPDIEFLVRQVDTLLTFYPNLDYVNIHTYEPNSPYVNAASVTTVTPVVVADMQEYLITRTGKPVMTNETGQRNNTSPTLVTTMLQNFDQLNFPYALWINGGDSVGETQPLYNLNTGALYPNGVAFSNFMSIY